MFGLALGATASTAFVGEAVPTVHDEFSYLLLGETLAMGRVANPPPELWQPFETFYVLVRPTYASKYPPASAVFIAIGIVTTGKPVAGIWLCAALMCLAVYWMLLAWTSPRWALLGALLAFLQFAGWGYWAQSFWGGAAAGLGGALLHGGMRRLVDGPKIRDTLLLAVGVGLLANSRPYEGLMASLPVALVLGVWLIRLRGDDRAAAIRRAVAPAAGVLLLIAGSMMYYNHRITGDMLQMPYQLHQQEYGRRGPFVWQLTERPYRNKTFEKFYRWETNEYKPPKGETAGELAISWWRYATGRMNAIGGYFFPVGGLLVLVLCAMLLGDRWLRLAVGLLLFGGLAQLLVVYHMQHYFAPYTGLAVLLQVAVLRGIVSKCPRRVGIGIVLLVCLLSANIAAARVHDRHRKLTNERKWSRVRFRMARELSDRPQRQLVVVRYGQKHDPREEWVYNPPDLESARLLWARETNPELDRRLLERYADREVWLLEIDPELGGGFRLTKHPGVGG